MSAAAEFWNAEQAPDPRPGKYYVSATNGERYWIMRGPYDSHSAALADVRETMLKAIDLDPKAFWMKWGTCRWKNEHSATPGRMNGYFQVTP
jgi:hypothetical protein